MSWQPTACILCSRNCGLEVELEGRRLVKIRGDERHPISAGYICQKAARLDHYQTHADRLTAPLKRQPDGSYQPVPWATAIQEIAAKLVAIRDTHGGRALAYYGGGGQGNHLGGIYGRGLVEAMQTRFHYSALAQEKTGDFWVNGKLFGRQTCHTTEDPEHAEVALFIGTNPYQAHGIRNARDTLRALSNDQGRTMIVVDPRRTETAALADLHLQLRPGTDAFLMAAMLGTIAQEGLENRAFLTERCTGFEALRARLLEVPVEAYAARADLDPGLVREVARKLARAKSASVRIDLGLQQSLHSTLNSYLEKLLYLVTGHFGREGCNNFHTFFLPLIGHSDERRGWRTTVTDFPEIGKLFPPNVLPAEIDSEHPGRLRGLIVDSANPMRSAADTRAYERAFAKLELCVVIDVALTETARAAHYVLPAASQLEKHEATFFNLEFPTQGFHLRRPLLAPLGDSLPEPEIYRRLLVAMGELPESFPVLSAMARLHAKAPGLGAFPAALAAAIALKPRLKKYGAFVLYQTLGETLPHGAKAAAPLWFAAHEYAARHPEAVRRVGLSGQGRALGEALFNRVLESPSGGLISQHLYQDTWSFIRHDDGKIHLDVPEMLAELQALGREAPHAAKEYPLVLIAGERRAYNANTIYRDPAWRKNDADGALGMHPDDAAAAGLSEGALATCRSEGGEIEVRVRFDERLRRGVVTLPHGYGLDHPTEDGRRQVHGPILNLLTRAEHRDPITATPYHKHVPVQVAPVLAPAEPAPAPSAG